MKKAIVAVFLSAVFVLAAAVLIGGAQTQSAEVPQKADVTIPMSASRPGCEKENWCYTPPMISTDAGKTITWINDDSGFHTVTSGYYDKADGMFDSGHIDPGKTFSYTFEKPGDFHYYCNLHPWMEGIVIVN